MIEPATIIGGIGFGIGVLSFLSSTVTNIARQEGEFRHCHSRLEAFSYQLVDRQIEMLNWKSIWYGSQGFSEDTYFYCWGVDGYYQIVQRLELIDTLTTTILRHLKLRISARRDVLSRSERLDWDEMMKRLESNPRQPAGTRAFLGKVTFTISGNMKLGEELTRLKILVEGLISFSRTMFRNRQGMNIETCPTHEELQKLDELRHMRNETSDFAVKLQAGGKYDQYQCEWDLELRPPDWDGDATSTDIPGSISLDFLVQIRCDCNQWAAQRFRIDYRTRKSSTPQNDDPAQIGVAIMDHLRNCTTPFTNAIRLPQSKILETPRSKGRPVKELLSNGSQYAVERKAYEQERISAAVGIVNWLFILWNSPWTSSPGLCHIHRTTLQNLRGPYVIQAFCNSQVNSSCENGDYDQKRLLLLGRLLAELALGNPLSMQKTSNGQILFVKDLSIMTKEELLQHLRRNCGSIGIVEAAGYCLLNEDRGPDARVERLYEDAKNIIQP